MLFSRRPTSPDSGEARHAWLEGYLTNLVTRDVEQLEDSPTRRRDTARLRRYLEARALSFVVAQLRPELLASSTRPRLHHLRTAQGRHEIDLLAELGGGRLIGIEVKAGGGARREDARHLGWLRDEVGERFIAGVVLHTGPHTYELDERIFAAPICSLWG